MKIQYRFALMGDNFQGYKWLDIANTEADVRRIQGYADFIKWIHEDWQEVES